MRDGGEINNFLIDSNAEGVMFKNGAFMYGDNTKLRDSTLRPQYKAVNVYEGNAIIERNDISNYDHLSMQVAIWRHSNPGTYSDHIVKGNTFSDGRQLLAHKSQNKILAEDNVATNIDYGFMNVTEVGFSDFPAGVYKSNDITLRASNPHGYSTGKGCLGAFKNGHVTRPGSAVPGFENRCVNDLSEKLSMVEVVDGTTDYENPSAIEAAEEAIITEGVIDAEGAEVLNHVGAYGKIGDGDQPLQLARIEVDTNDRPYDQRIDQQKLELVSVTSEKEMIVSMGSEYIAKAPGDQKLDSRIEAYGSDAVMTITDTRDSITEAAVTYKKEIRLDSSLALVSGVEADKADPIVKANLRSNLGLQKNVEVLAQKVLSDIHIDAIMDKGTLGEKIAHFRVLDPIVPMDAGDAITIKKAMEPSMSALMEAKIAIPDARESTADMLQIASSPFDRLESSYVVIDSTLTDISRAKVIVSGDAAKEIHTGHITKIGKVAIETGLATLDKTTELLMKQDPITLERFAEARIHDGDGHVATFQLKDELATRTIKESDLERVFSVASKYSISYNMTEVKSVDSEHITKMNITLISDRQKTLEWQVGESITKIASDYEQALLNAYGADVECVATSTANCEFMNIKLYDPVECKVRANPTETPNKCYGLQVGSVTLKSYDPLTGNAVFEVWAPVSTVLVFGREGRTENFIWSPRTRLDSTSKWILHRMHLVGKR
jgi:hypothetical protein